MPRFRELKGRVTAMPVSRIRPMQIPDEVAISSDRAERNLLYKSERWVRMRKRMLATSCRHCMFCHERTSATVLEHVVGHGVDAQQIAKLLGLPDVHEDWHQRFWAGPYSGSCLFHARQRSGHEAAGTLLNWTKRWLASKLD